MRPLDRVGSIKLKLGLVIVAAVVVSAVTSTVGLRLGISIWLRPVIAATLSLGLVQVLSRGMTSPLREMAIAADAMARGERVEPIRATSRDEVGQLARAFNEMTAQLAEVDRHRRDLVANVSHELRTPIGALRAMLENLVDGVGAPDADALRTMLRQVERLGRLVAQLLDLSRLEAGMAPIERTRFDVAHVLGHAADEARVHWPDVPVRVDAPADLSVVGDPERVHQVIANLLENAARFTPVGGSVELRARQQGDGVRIEVVDDGPGIADHDVAHVFDRFYRADHARSGTGGAGLGLAIARWIVELHGGEIRVEHAEQRGCRMVVFLPKGAS
jgi:signal transduction histidine kinase